MAGELNGSFRQRQMKRGQMWIAGKGEWKNHLRIDWASSDKELKNKLFTRCKQADKTLFSAGRQRISSPAVEVFHGKVCDAMVAKFSCQTSEG